MYTLVSNPVFRRLFFLVRICGSIIAFLGLVTEVTYLFKHQFSSITFFVWYATLCAAKFLIPIALCFYHFRKRVIGHKPKAFTYDIDHQQRMELNREYLKAGFLLYTAIPFLYVTGFYRTVNTQHFALEVGFGFGFDFVFTLSFFFLQGINNATLNADTPEKYMALGPLQSVFISVKILQLADLILEFFMFIFEVYRLRNLSKQSVDVVVKFDEEKRRKIFYHTYFKRAITSLSLFVIPILVMSVTLPAKSCKQQQSLEFNTVCMDCKLTGCLNCEESGADKCDVCDQGLYYDSTQNKCLDCDEYEDAVLCRKCDGYNQCTECNVGYRLGQYGSDWQGRCRPCDDPQCALCNELTGQCDECREGWFLKN